MCVVWLKYTLKEKERMRKIMKTVLATALLVVVMAGQVYAYSSNWRTDSNNNWLYYENGTAVTDAWVHDDGYWYLLDGNGIMRTGLFRSNNGHYYLLDTVRGTGSYGKLLVNGSVYKGVKLECDTSSEYEGALSEKTIAELKKAGVSFNDVPDVSNTRHVEATAQNNNGDGQTQQKQENAKQEIRIE